MVFTSDNSAIAASIVANIILSFSIELQKYTKKQIIQLALHGVSSISLQILWKCAISLLVVAECLYYVWYGFEGTTSMTPMGVYTVFANCVLPPLLYRARSGPLGTTCTMMGILALIFVPAQQCSEINITWDNSLRNTLAVFIVVCLGLCGLRSYRPANCSLKLTANCGLSGLLGAIAVGLIKLLTSDAITGDSVCGSELDDPYGLCQYIPLGWAFILVLFFLQMVLLIETLEFFPVWQLVAHHHILFSIFTLSENVTIFGLYDQNKTFDVFVAFFSHFLVLVGVLISAKPQLDIPASISKSAILPSLAAMYNRNEERNSNNREPGFHVEGENNQEISTDVHRIEETMMNEMNLCCVKELYCSMMHDYLKENEGFSSCHSSCRSSNRPYLPQEGEP